MGGAMFSKSLIQFSVDGCGCALSLLFDMRPNYGGGNEDNGNSFKISCACTATVSAPNPAAGHWLSTTLPETPEHSQASLGQSLLGSLFFATPHYLKQSINPTYFKMFWMSISKSLLMNLKSSNSESDNVKPGSKPWTQGLLWCLVIIIYSSKAQ